MIARLPSPATRTPAWSQAAARLARGPGRHRAARWGVTLVELLITIVILSILAALILGVAAVAGETAREAKSRNMIARLHTLVMEHNDTYKSRRVRLQKHVIDEINDPNVNRSPAVRGRLMAQARLFALRELMLMEMPDRWSDVTLSAAGQAWREPLYLDATPVRIAMTNIRRSDLAGVYLRRYAALENRTNSLTGVQNTREQIHANESAECLYLFVTLATGDGEARSLFGESNIGDVDGDGAPEFLDGWGNPISFLRWAPGFASDLQLDVAELTAMTTDQRQAAIAADHDPFDIYRAEAGAFRLVPLIFSAGGDERAGLWTAPGYVTWRNTPANNVSVSGSSLVPALTPYVINPPDAYFGTAEDPATATDNIHNHLMGQR